MDWDCPFTSIGAPERPEDALIIQALNVQIHRQGRNVLCSVEDQFPIKGSSP